MAAAKTGTLHAAISTVSMGKKYPENIAGKASSNVSLNQHV